MSIKQKLFIVNQKIVRAFVDIMQAHIPNIHRATSYVVCIFHVNFGVFSIVYIELYKNVIYTQCRKSH